MCAVMVHHSEGIGEGVLTDWKSRGIILCIYNIMYGNTAYKTIIIFNSIINVAKHNVYHNVWFFFCLVSVYGKSR